LRVSKKHSFVDAVETVSVLRAAAASRQAERCQKVYRRLEKTA
jgi:hypothetical protein